MRMSFRHPIGLGVLAIAVAMAIGATTPLENSLFGRYLVQLNCYDCLRSTDIAAPSSLPAWPWRWLSTAALASLLWLNFGLLRRLSFRWQVAVIWLELALLFAAFFDAFDLNYGFIWERLGLLLTGTITTLYISVISIALACMLALIGALARLSRNGLAFGIAGFYVSFFRGTPLLLQVLLIYSGLPQINIILDAVPSGILALSLCYGAYMTEIFRAGIQSVPKGQWEASRALGLHERQILQKIILPQAMRVIVPPTGNQFIAMLKDSSIISVMGVIELTYMARNLGRSEFRTFEMLIAAAIIYWLLSLVLEAGQSRLEHIYRRADRR